MGQASPPVSTPLQKTNSSWYLNVAELMVRATAAKPATSGARGAWMSPMAAMSSYSGSD